ncbi:hypothetical protein SO802_028878 [Lithocarpus litseifolius]|uniref:Uncharacterized protein n=1 Tax=Lithocarpus litseifolius TaxID=425828 RepID=A0AAW2BV15_9ROSI
MAPKKSAPSKNLISRRGSSSSSSLPSVTDRVRFFDVDSQKDFIENFCDRAIHSERQVILSDFPNTPLLGAFSFQGWESLYEKPLRIDSSSPTFKGSTLVHRIDLSSPIHYRIDSSPHTFKGLTIVLPKPIGSTLVLLYTVRSTVALLLSRDRP